MDQIQTIKASHHHSRDKQQPITNPNKEREREETKE